MRNSILVLSFLILPFGELNAQTRNEPGLRGSANSMAKQNRVADEDNLSRLKDEAMIRRFVKNGLLVPLVDGQGIIIDDRLEQSRRFCRPWTVKFLRDLGTRFEKEFHKPLRVNSCVRDIKTQRSLRRFNRNAARVEGPRASTHLTGAAIDIARIGLSRKEQDFIRNRLRINESTGKIEATEEHMQAVWHVMVFKAYSTSVLKKKR